MRFGFLVVAAAAAGAASVTAVSLVIPQGITFPSVATVVRALGGDPAQFNISLDDLNPAKIYADMMQKVLSAPIGAPINIGSSSCDPDYPLSFAHGCRHEILSPLQIQPNVFKIDDAEMKRAMAAGVQQRFQQDYQRSQAMQQFARDPGGWHGPPPQ